MYRVILSSLNFLNVNIQFGIIIIFISLLGTLESRILLCLKLNYKTCDDMLQIIIYCYLIFIIVLTNYIIYVILINIIFSHFCFEKKNSFVLR